jgi:hypothetical protein
MNSLSTEKAGSKIPFIEYKKNRDELEKSRLKVLRK